jgi:predicted ATPase
VQGRGVHGQSSRAADHPQDGHALVHASLAHSYCGIYAAANAEAAEDVALANEIGSLFWAAFGTTAQGFVSALTGKVSDALQTIASGLAALRPTGTRMWLPLYLSSLAGAYAELGQFDDAWRCIEEARATMEITKERWWEAEAHRTAGEIALKSPKPDAAKAQAYFERALAVARAQQAKSLELRAAMSMARLWREQSALPAPTGKKPNNHRHF